MLSPTLHMTLNDLVVPNPRICSRIQTAASAAVPFRRTPFPFWTRCPNFASSSLETVICTEICVGGLQIVMYPESCYPKFNMVNNY